MERFSTEETAIKYFEAIRWLHNTVCPHGGNNDHERMWVICSAASKRIRAGLRKCARCKKQFRVTVDTVIENSHVPLNLWIIACSLISGAKKDMSAFQLQRHPGIDSYKTAWFRTGTHQRIVRPAR